MDKSPEFAVIERVLNSAADTEEQLEQSWIEHYISLADRLLKRSLFREPAKLEDDGRKAA
jgi:hypothetical protein